MQAFPVEYNSRLRHTYHAEGAFYTISPHYIETSAGIAAAGDLTRQFNRDPFNDEINVYRTVVGYSGGTRVWRRDASERVETSTQTPAGFR